MKNRFYIVVVSSLVVLSYVSCADKYVIEGTTSQYFQDGTVAYIKQFEVGSQDYDFKAIDSCEVLHGKFDMTGALDSVMMVRLYMGTDNFPMVLEPGKVTISIADNIVKIEGTELNERLYAFLTQRDSLKIMYDDLPKRESKMYLDGYTQQEIIQELGAEELRLQNEVDRLETRFVKDNYDNVLGVTWFLRLCYEARDYYGFVTTTPQIDEIYMQAPDSFKKNRLVSTYMSQVNN
ncbi:MAG: DUF4369 domain-containing protein [Bacteroidaceae bacterium]|nr:DUF4369 domain-containing protein [Bacteroidaceae bacterium]